MVSVQSFSEVGGHAVNEDGFIVEPHPLDADCWTCFVADGQGGQRGGGPAAALACKTAHGAVVKSRPADLLDPDFWSEALYLADRAVHADAASGFTTLVGLCVYRDIVAGASNGDSAAMLIAEGTHHELTSGQNKNPPIGSGGASSVPFTVKVSKPWRVLVMSDGVWKYVGWERVADIAQRETGQALVQAMQQAARLPNSGRFQDDFTLILIEDWR